MQLTSTTYWAALLFISLGAGWLAWRYVALRRGIRRLNRNLGDDDEAGTQMAEELRDLSRRIRLVRHDRSQELSGLQAERDRLAAVLDQMTDGVLIADDLGEIRYCNPAASHIFQIPNPIGRSLTEVLRDHRLVAAWHGSRDRGEIQMESVELAVRRQFIQLVVVPDSHGGGSLLLAQDLTTMRRLETVRQDFVSNISHELRTPLASIRALAETLMDGAVRDPSAAPRFLAQMINEVDALTQMSQELLDLASIESGKAGLTLEHVAPVELLDLAAKRMRLQAERAGLEIRIDCPEAPPAVLADAGRLGQVVVNLIHNAVKFTPPGGQITLAAGRLPEPSTGGGQFVEFSVRDTGRGISADDLPRIFERFYRADKARSSGGTGLGLSIARHIVEAHGGQIWAESVEGQGSTFRFTIPRSQ